MKTIVVASENPVKIQTVERAFGQVFPKEEFTFIGVKAASGVRDQPLSNFETLKGAWNRMEHAEKLSPEADFYVGLEGGVEDVRGKLHEFAWIVIKSKDGRVGQAKSATFIAPPIFHEMVLAGKEIGDITDIVFGEQNSKHKMGAIGLLTNGVIDRMEFYRHAVILALLPFIHPDLYQ